MIRFKKNALLICSILVSVIIITYLIISKKLNIEILLVEDTTIHFNLLTVNAVITGFMFTTLGLMVSVSGHFMVKELERANHMDRVYNNIITGIISTITSIFISLLIIFSIINIQTAIAKIMVSLELIGLVIGIITLAISMIDLKFIINLFRREEKQIPDEVFKGLKNKINNKKESAIAMITEEKMSSKNKD